MYRRIVRKRWVWSSRKGFFSRNLEINGNNWGKVYRKVCGDVGRLCLKIIKFLSADDGVIRKIEAAENFPNFKNLLKEEEKKYKKEE